MAEPLAGHSCSGVPKPDNISITFNQATERRPTYVCANGTPLGIQFIARKGNESLLLQMAKFFEDHHQFKMLQPTLFS